MQWNRLVVGTILLSVQALACAPQAASPAARAQANGPVQARAAEAPAGAPTQAQSAPAAPPALTRLIVGHFPATHTAGIYIAQERGYFAEQGLDADLTPFQSLPDAALLLNSGQMDIYGGGTGANLYNAVARGIGLRAVADKAHSEAGVKYKGFMARKDLWDSGEIRTIADLRERPVSSLPSGGGVEYQMDKVLQTAALTTDDLHFKGLGVPEQLSALANKGVDAAFLFQPALCTAEKRGLAVVIPPLLDDVAAGLQGGVINYGAHFIQERPDAARGFMVAYVKALRDYNDAQHHGADRDLIIDIMAKYVRLPDRSYFEDCEWGRLNPDGRIDRKWIEDEMQWSVKTGLLDHVVPVDQLVDDSYVDYALQVLGPYKPAGQ
jgi:NitT/TauT family transport system substrate-binding protein